MHRAVDFVADGGRACEASAHALEEDRFPAGRPHDGSGVATCVVVALPDRKAGIVHIQRDAELVAGKRVQWDWRIISCDPLHGVQVAVSADYSCRGGSPLRGAPLAN